jgi:hypothetical protein
VFEVSNRLFFVSAGADEEISGSPVTGQNYIYAVTNPNGATFKYSTTKPVWNAVKSGWYNGADRAVAKFVYSGGQYKQKKILGKRRSGEYTSVQNPGDVVEFYQGGVMRAQIKMALAGLLLSGLLTACDGVMSRGDIKVVTINPTGWQKITMPSASKWTGVTYGNGKFVAVGSTSTGAYSTDGINWQKITLPANMTGVTYGNGKVVAVGSTSTGAYSTDGINWTATTLPSGSWKGIAYGNGKFVATSTSNTNNAMYSADGINWTAIPLPASTGYWSSVCYNDNGRFVAVDNASASTTNVAAYLDTFTVKLVYNADGTVRWVKA